MSFYPNLCCYLQVQSDYAAQLNRFSLVESVEIIKTKNVNIAGEGSQNDFSCLLWSFRQELTLSYLLGIPVKYAAEGLHKN